MAPGPMHELDVTPTVKKARVEIIPLIDVVFFLLATFVLFTLSLQSNRVLDPDLPRGDVDGRPDERTLYIQASAPGTYYWRRGTDEAAAELVSSGELRAKLLEYRDEAGAPRVFIRSDTNARFGDAVLVLDEVRRAGIKQVAIETRATKTGL